MKIINDLELLNEFTTTIGIKVRVYKHGIMEHMVMKSNDESWFPELEDEENEVSV